MDKRDRLIHFLVALPRWQKRALCLIADTVLIMIALWLAFILRLGYKAVSVREIAWMLSLAPAISLPVFIKMGLYRAIVRYIGSDALKTILHAVTLSALLLALCFFWFKDESTLIPRSVIVIYWLLCILLIGGTRFGVRNFINRDIGLRSLFLPSFTSLKPHASPVIVYGAGAAGFELMGSLSRSREFLPIAFLDDDPDIQGRIMAGYPVVAPSLLPKLIEQHFIRYVLLAMPSVPRSKKQQIIKQLETLNVHVKTLPSVNEMAEGKIAIQDIQDVDIADLLGRDPVAPLSRLLSLCILEKNVLVTGAGGSIGSELCRQILRQKPAVMVLFEQSEFALYKIERELLHIRSREALPTRIVPVLGSVCAWGRMLASMKRFHIHTVYHAAAYKHVPLVEQNMAEGLRNNLFGTLVAAQAALVSGVERFILISTDKAVRPTNVMGASKRMAEMVLQALNDVRILQSPLLVPVSETRGARNQTCFSMVRFGNVLGSSGSVIPLFRKQIEAGGPVTVTHPKITRFFMTIPEAAELVIQAGAMARGGEVFLLDMGEPVSILTLARRMILLSGRTIRDTENPAGDIEIVFSGLRPGEKLYEELLIDVQDKKTTEHPKIFHGYEKTQDWEWVLSTIEELHRAMQYCWPHGAPENCDCEELRNILKRRLEGYQPQCGIVDVIWEKSGQTDFQDLSLETFRAN